MQRPRSTTLFSNYTLNLSFPTRYSYDSFEKKSRGAEGVFSYFLSVLWWQSSFLFFAATRFILLLGIPALISLLLSTMASAMTLETFKNWHIQYLDEEFIFVQSHRDIKDSEILTFGFQKGRCERVSQFFELYTMANHPELEQLMNKELQLRENGSPAEGKVIHIQPHKGGHLILVDMGYYKQEDVRDYYNYHKRFRVTVTHHPLEESIPLTNLFDVPTQEWSIEDIQGVLDRAEYHCKRIPDPLLAHQSSNFKKGLKI